MRVDYKYSFNGLDHAARMLNKSPNITTLKITMEFDTGTMETEITVNTAEQLAKDLLGYAKDIREYAESLKSQEVESR